LKYTESLVRYGVQECCFIRSNFMFWLAIIGAESPIKKPSD